MGIMHAYDPCMHANYICIACTHIMRALILCMHILHAYHAFIARIMHACILCMHILHACVLCMHILNAYCRSLWPVPPIRVAKRICKGFAARQLMWGPWEATNKSTERHRPP